jgi:hypothetical protein
MESVRTGRRIGDILNVAMLLCLALAWPVGAESGGNPDSRDGSLTASVVIGASRPQPDQGRREPAETPADRPIAASGGAAPDLDIALEAPSDVMAPFADMPLAAWLLVGVCILGAGLLPRARPRTRSDEEDAPLAQPPAGGEVRRTDLRDPRRTPG